MVFFYRNVDRKSILQNGHRRGVMVGVAETQMDDAAGALMEEAQPGAMQNHERLPAVFPAHFHVLPAEVLADPGPEGLRDRFLGGKSRREERGGVLVRERVGDLGRLEDAVHEPLTELLERRRDAGDFDDVDAL